MMATGYVHPVADGEITDLRAFALLCSRAMMATVQMRDEPLSTPPPQEFAPQLDYLHERLAEAKSRLAYLTGLTPEQRVAACENEWDERLSKAMEWDKESREEVTRVKAMKARVDAWEGAPEGLKEFMLDQLNRSLDGADFSHAKLLGERMAADDWFQDAFRRAVDAVGRATGEIEAEISRTAMRNAWLKQLWDSLPPASEPQS